MFCSGTILLLLVGPIYGFWSAILDPKEITEGSSSLSGRWPPPSMDKGGQVHYKEGRCRQQRHMAGHHLLTVLDAASEMKVKSLIY